MLIDVPLGGLFAIIQAFFVISSLSWLAHTSFTTGSSLIFLLVYAIGVFICAVFTSIVGLLELKWNSIIAGILAGLVFFLTLFIRGGH